MENIINIADIIKEKNIVTLFQPVISIRDRRVIGYEALTRGICSSTGKLIQPLKLFALARAEKLDLELDRLCRKKALQAFKNIYDYKKYILFLNLDTSVINNSENGVATVTKEYTDELGLEYSSISLEIVESKIECSKKLSEFVDHYRRLGYYVSLDDFGAMHSNLNRIVSSKPDIIKIDIELIKNVSTNYYQQSIISSIIALAKKTGSLTLAEGLETKEDIIMCYELGVDLYQGFYFYKPCPDIKSNMQFIESKIDYIVNSIKYRLSENALRRKNQHSSFDFIIDIFIKESTGKTIAEYEYFLNKRAVTFEEVERVFLLDKNGTQVIKSISNLESLSGIKAFKSFCMLNENDSDHSLKDYFYYLDKIDSDRFYTDTYLSAFSGRVLRTMSCNIYLSGEQYTLCVEFVDSKEDSLHQNRARCFT